MEVVGFVGVLYGYVDVVFVGILVFGYWGDVDVDEFVDVLG